MKKKISIVIEPSLIKIRRNSVRPGIAIRSKKEKLAARRKKSVDIDENID